MSSNESLIKAFRHYIVNKNANDPDTEMLTEVYNYITQLETNNQRFNAVRLYYSYIHEMLG